MKHIKKYLIYFIVVLSLFPYSPPIISSSTQPLAPALVTLFIVLVFLMFLLGRSLTIRKNSLCLLSIFIVLAFLQLVKSTDFLVYSIYLSKYFVAFCFFWFGYVWLETVNSHVFFISLFIWVVAAFVQLYDVDFLSFFVSGQEISIGRGVPSFAPEPSFFSIHFGLIFLIFLRLWVLGRINKDIYLLSVFFILIGLILSLSGTSFIILFFIGLILLADKKLWKTIFPIFMILMILMIPVFLNFDAPQGIRIGDIITELIDGNILYDASIMTRFYYILLGFLPMISGDVLGFEFSAYENYGLSIFDSVPGFINEFFSFIDQNSNGKIHSLFATVSLDFGFLAVLIALFIFLRFLISVSCFSQIMLIGKITIIVFLLFLILLPVPIGSPLFFSVIGVYASKIYLLEGENFNG